MTTNGVEAWIAANRARLSSAVTDRQYDRMPGLAERYGAAGRAHCESDAGYHLDYLGAAAARGATALFLDYVAWAKALLANLKIPGADLRVNLECLRDTLQDEAPEELSAALLPPVSEALAQLDSMPETTPSLIDPTGRHAGLARRYLDHMLAGRRHEAMRIIVDAANGGTSVREIYLDVFTPVQHEIGRLWQHNMITVAEEHYCTAVTQLVISQLYSHIFSAERRDRTLVATCVTGDLHEIGVRMVADFFEMDGWDTYYLGANVPARSIAKTVVDKGASVVAISATMTVHVDAVANLISQLRADEATRSVQILVGGYPFNVEPELWKSVGADSFARDAQEAVDLGNAFVDGSET